MQSASRLPLTSVRKPAKSEFPEYLYEVSVKYNQARYATSTSIQQARTRATAADYAEAERPNRVARRGAGATNAVRRLS
ncbi:unnamed protein product [Arctia plantaginis]|uniref:Uncharacterized protein n=1 Tax=Arctia plantaginis TaxID=874455 RepID=A0A8S1B3N7_ARCPL|nr:unnamed protein product [Arctia plantaginis]